MDSTIQYTDLFDADFIKRINEVATALQGMNGEIKNIASSVLGSISSISNTTTALSALTAQVNALQQAQQQVQQAQQATSKVMSGMAALTDTERQSVEALRQSLDNWRLTWNTNMRMIDTANKSYNELKASYNAIDEALNKMSDAERSNTAAGQNMINQIRDIKNALQNMDNQYKKAAQSASTLGEVQRRFPKLQQFEIGNVEAFAKSIETLRQDLSQSLPAIDMQQASYNQLYATYNVLKDALNQMTVEQRNNTAAGQTMTEQARKLMEQLNTLQAATGKYTLNVGNYASAFDGFGYSIQQVLREIPSATTLNQFFLAISNNIPMVADQIRKFTAEQTELHRKANEAMQAGNKETADAIAAQYQSLGKKIVSSVLNWQSAILIALLFLKKYGSEWIHSALNAIKRFFNNVVSIGQTTVTKIQSMFTSLDIKVNVSKRVAEVKTEMDLLIGIINKAEKGTDEWRNAIDRVNELTKQNLDYIKATPAEVKKIGEEYIKMQTKIAQNQYLLEALAESETNRLTRRLAMKAIQKETERVSAEQKPYLEALAVTNASPIERVQYARKYYGVDYSTFVSTTLPQLQEKAQINRTVLESVVKLLGITDKEQEDAIETFQEFMSLSKKDKGYQKAKKEVQDLLNKYKPSLTESISDIYVEAQIDTEEWLKSLYSPIKTTDDNGDGGKQLKANFQLLDDLYEEWLQNRYKTIQDAYDREMAMENDRYELQYRKFIYEYTKRLENLKTALNKGIITQEQYDSHLLDLQQQMGVKVEENYSEQYKQEAAQFKKDLDNKLITEKQYERMMIELQIQHKNELIVTQTSLYGIIQGITQEHEDKVREIVTNSHKQTLESLKASEEGKIKAIKDSVDEEIKYQKKRVKNAKDEIYNNKVATQNIETYTDAINQLNDELVKLNVLYDALIVKTPFDTEAKDETEKKIKEAIKFYQDLINKEVKKYSTSQQTKKLGSLWDIVGEGINFSDNFKKGVLEKLGIDASKLTEDEIGGLFQNWLDSAESAFGDWADKIRDTLSGLLDAYIDFYNARAEAAAEDTDAAKEEYEKQKALLEAGYASSIETEWTQYQEKKRIQKQAERDAAEWTERQRQLNQLETVASLGTTVANLYKSMSTAGIAGIAAATAASAALLTMFATTQSQIAGTVKYGEGHVEMISGGSHASGHDSPLAMDQKGRQRRVEGGEMFAVINKRAVRKYGYDNIADIINGINARNLESGVDGVKVAMFGMDLGRIERSLDTIVGNGRNTTTVDAQGNIIVRRGNFTKKITYTRN